ncbi:hypothetical protein [Pelotalea chapellei]|uniref:Uncharacterized protein n=1 Tax=Pelotalea chapellei TaxID=44671 RepID=A0ABS5UCP5_9BACT|nr:hypothetical protein [Pelotalea chapellei]MBT1073447.1 hypothetical protein [Pelotalea chapellei]
MKINETEKLELENLERSADDLLSSLAVSGNYASDRDLQILEQYAGRAAKIAFGIGQADLLSYQMLNLIRWTDHLNDDSWVENFKMTLRNRPLVNPFGNLITNPNRGDG